jgi:hypothetical protein
MLQGQAVFERCRPARFLTGLLCAAALGVAAIVSVTRADDDQALDHFLGRLGLNELRLTHLERRVAHEPAAEKRAQLARQLADAYAEELVAAADEPDRFTRLKARADKLLAAMPEARTRASQVALLQADYQRAETLVIRWMEDNADRQPLDEAAKAFERIESELSALQAEITAAADRAAEAADTIKIEAHREAAEKQVQRQRAVAARADYFAGWSAYYLGVARQGTKGSALHFAAAKQHFCRLLDVSDDNEYAGIEPDALALDSSWRSRAVIGLGLSELGQKKLAAAARLFSLLRHATVPPAIADQAAYWHMQGMLNVGLLKDAARLVTSEVAALGGGPSAGKSSLCVAAVRAGARGRSADERHLLTQGIRGLARMRQFETLDSLIAKHHLDDGAAADFCLSWLRGRRQYLEAEKSKKGDDFRAALAALTSALNMSEARQDVMGAGQARYYLAWARFRLDEFDASARLFHDAAVALAAAAPDVAAQAAWMRCTSLVQLAAKDKRQVAAAMAALQGYKQDYPASEESQRAELLLVRLRQSSSSPEDAIRDLAAIKPSDVTYLSAQYEICQLQYQRWNKVKADAATAQPIALELLKYVEQFLSLAKDEADAELRLKATLLAVDVLDSASAPDSKRIALLLDGAAAASQQLAPDHPAVIEYQYRRLRQHQRSGDASGLRAAGQWIVTNGGGTQYELPALVVMAREADKAVASASASERAARAAEAQGLYQRLVALLGESSAVLSSNKNAFAATSKLAQYDEELAQWPPAADKLTRLVEVQPKDGRLLRRAGLACYQAGRYEAALKHWRTLLTGIPSGSEEWLEAKYYQLACLEKLDADNAAHVWQQFQLLFPDVKSPTWGPRFAEMAKRLQ